jgi:hypothetical protein
MILLGIIISILFCQDYNFKSSLVVSSCTMVYFQPFPIHYSLTTLLSNVVKYEISEAQLHDLETYEVNVKLSLCLSK